MYTGDNYAVWKSSRKPNKTYHGITYFIVGGQYLWILRQTLKIYA